MASPSSKTARGILIGIGITFIVLSVVILATSAWEGFGGLGKKFQIINLPGFHELQLKEAGLYGGVYQHRGTQPMPARQLMNMDVRILSKDTYESIPVMMNTTGQTFNRLGVRGMPLFNFLIQRPGAYTLSAIYLEGTSGPTVPIMVFPQAAQNVKQTIIVGSVFFALFLVLGIIILVNVKKWVPSSP